MTNRNWLEKTWNRIQGLTEQDFENCNKLSVLTGLEWKPYRAPTEHQETTIYAAYLKQEGIAEAVANKLNELLSTQEKLNQLMSPLARTFVPALDRVITVASSIMNLEVKEDANLADVKTAVAATIGEAREASLKKTGRMLLNNIPG